MARSPKKDVGAMTSPNQRAIVEAQVEMRSPRAQGGDRRQTSGGPGDYFEPTVLVGRRPLDDGDARRDLRPVVGVMKVRDSEEALRFANDTRYGLAASVFGEKERAEKVGRRIEAARSKSTTWSSTTS